MEQPTVKPVPDNVVDLLAEKAKAGLNDVASGGKRTREGWRKYGEALLEARAVYPSNQDYNQWIADNELDVPPAASSATRSDAVWLAEHWQQVEKHFTFERKTDLHHPQNIRTACRAAGFEWAKAKPKKDGSVKRVRVQPKSTAKQITYLVALQRATKGDLPIGVDHIQRRDRGGIRTLLDEEWKKLYGGAAIPEYVPEDDEEAIARLATTYRNIVLRQKPQTSKARIERVGQEIIAEKNTLPEKMQAKFDRLYLKLKTELDTYYHEQLELAKKQHRDELFARIDELLADQKQIYDEKIEEAAMLRRTIREYMSEEEFKKVRSVLHPDRIMDPVEKRKFDEAFSIINRLAERFDKKWTHAGMMK
jgi:hypothetical protein